MRSFKTTTTTTTTTEQSMKLILSFVLCSTWLHHNVFGQDLDLSDTFDENSVGVNEDRHSDRGSWSHWWSYDGISGPDYWHINKQWLLCSIGRKQSPINIRTDRLVYDHLLEPIQLSWLRRAAGSGADVGAAGVAAQATAGSKQTEPTSNDNNMDLRRAINTNGSSVRVHLLNSGRGLEAWLEQSQPSNGNEIGGGAASASTIGGDITSQAQVTDAAAAAAVDDQLILSGGPLSYAYKLFKIELHSAPTYTSNRMTMKTRAQHQRQQAATATNSAPSANHQTSPVNGAAAAADDELPEALRVGRSSEHLIDGHAFDGELQLHFYNKQFARSAREAMQLASSPDHSSSSAAAATRLAGARSSSSGSQLPSPSPSLSSSSPASLASSSSSLFTVISVFIATETATETAPAATAAEQSTTTQATQTPVQPASVLDLMLDNLGALKNAGDSVQLRLSRQHLDQLIADRSEYITYAGSMNRPPCTETIDWILMNKALRVDSDRFRALFASTNTNMENVRPVKGLNRRQLRTTIRLRRSNRLASNQSNQSRDSRRSQQLGSGDCVPQPQSNYSLGSDTVPSTTKTECARGEQGSPGPAKTIHPGGCGSTLNTIDQPTCRMKPSYAYQFNYGLFKWTSDS